MFSLKHVCFYSLMQTYTAVYYALADLVMLGMYFYYKGRNKSNTSECFQ